MTKKDKFHLIKWITLCALAFLLCAYGFILQLNGYGKTGKIRQDLTKIVKIYNSLSTTQNNIAKIKAKYKNKKIVVNYKLNEEETKYTFKYEKNGEFKTITITYLSKDSSKVEDIVKGIIEAISITAGNQEGKVFSQYKYQNFYKTELKDGVSIRQNGNYITAQLVLETNLLENIKDIFFEESFTTHVSIEDLEDLEKDLENNEKFLITKGNVMLYVVEKENEYLIYSSDKEQNKKNIYESIMSVISILNTDAYNDIINSKIDITQESIRNNYKSEINPEKIEYNQIMNNSFVVKVTLNK